MYCQHPNKVRRGELRDPGVERKRRKSCEHASKNIDKINKRRIKLAIIFQCTAKPTTNSRSEVVFSVYCEPASETYHKLTQLLRRGSGRKVLLLLFLAAPLSKSPCPPPSLILFLGSNPPDNLTERNEQKKNVRNLCVSLEDNEVTCPWCLQKPSSPRSMRVVLAHLCARARGCVAQFPPHPPVPIPLSPPSPSLSPSLPSSIGGGVCRPTSASSH